MSGFLLDTNCISELIRPRPERRVVEWIEATNEALLYLSVLTLGEIRKGVAALPRDVRRTRVESWLEIELQGRFAGRILVVDAAAANRWGVLAAEAKRRGKPLAVIDGLLAATALQHDLTVVTRNSNDFVQVNVPVFNPWDA